MAFKVGDRVRGHFKERFLGTVIEITSNQTYPIRVRWDVTGLVGANSPGWISLMNGLQLIKERHNL